MSTLMELLNEGDIVQLRNGTTTSVDFIAYMPDDLSFDYPYVVRLSGHEACTYSEDGCFEVGYSSPNDILNIL